VLYSVAFLVVATGTWAATSLNDPSGSGEFFEALDRARDAGTAQECYEPPVSSRRIRLSHREIVAMSRCFARHGYVTQAGLRLIESDRFEYTYYRAFGRTVGGTVTSFTVAADPVPKWVIGLWLSGLAAVIWLVGFRLPWWHRPRTV